MNMRLALDADDRRKIFDSTNWSSHISTIYDSPVLVTILVAMFADFDEFSPIFQMFSEMPNYTAIPINFAVADFRLKIGIFSRHQNAKNKSCDSHTERLVGISCEMPGTVFQIFKTHIFATMPSR